MIGLCINDGFLISWGEDFLVSVLEIENSDNKFFYKLNIFWFFVSKGFEWKFNWIDNG